MARRIVASATEPTSPNVSSVRATVPPGVKVEPWGDSFNIYTGHAEVLISAGLVDAAQVPAKPAKGKVQVSFHKGERVPKGCPSRRFREDTQNYVRVEHFASGRVAVMRGVPAEETERRKAEWLAKLERDRQESKARREKDAYGSPESLRDFAGSLCRMLAWALASHTPGDHERKPASYHCRFSPEGFDEILESVVAVHEWIKTANITRPSDVTQKVDAARTDSAFQSFLQEQCLKE